MLKFNPDKTNCTGCSACYSVCPKQCITMKQDVEGFYYPELLNNDCIDCGLCQKVCPMVNHKPKNSYPKVAVAAIAKDYAIWHRSASGGAFSEIVRHWSNDETLIVGAAWEGLQVHHVGVIGFDNITPLCKSKYVASHLEDTFKMILQHLKKDKKVIFCGCPCQVDGLHKFLRKKYDNLLTLDLICHGQGSPYVFKECMRVIGYSLGEKIIKFEFRTKRKFHEQDYLTLVETYKSKYYLSEDPYTQLFLSQNALRPSCGSNCKYRNISRPGDLTIADCKGLTKIFPDLLGTKYNWSTIVSNTASGENVLHMLHKTMQIRPCSLENVIEYNPLFARQTWFSKSRDVFFEEFRICPDSAIYKYTKPFNIVNPSFRARLFNIAPVFLRRIYLKLYK